MGLLVGHDLGTHANKAVLLDESGRILAKSVEPYGIQLSGHDRAEQDPEVWWQAVCLCTRRLLEQSGRAGHEVDAVGFAGQMLALVPRVRILSWQVCQALIPPALRQKCAAE